MIDGPRDDALKGALKRLQTNTDFCDLLEHWLRREQASNRHGMTWETEDTALRMRQGVDQALTVILNVCDKAQPADTGNGLPHRRTPHRLPTGNTITRGS